MLKIIKTRIDLGYNTPAENSEVMDMVRNNNLK